MLLGFQIAQDYSRVGQTNPPPKELTYNYGFTFIKENWTSNASSGFHGCSYASNNSHARFQALEHNFAQSTTQMIKNQLYWTKSQLWSRYSQTSFFGQHQDFELTLII